MRHSPTAKLLRAHGVTPPAAPVPLLPAHLETTYLPPRLQAMLALLLAHEEAICRYPIGVLELHFGQESVEAKMGCNLSR